ncbi:CBS domain-containing protein [Candidatus Marsarchaeota archaeon]|jgi:CBS domain-containing protein|nr:CBS domain-containing protein [Candidatus Marsarchaeota archaeon]
MNGEDIMVGDAMTTDVVVAKPSDLVSGIAKLMAEKEIGSVIVVDEDMYPLGIVTEGDIVRNVIAEDKDPKTTAAKEIMTAPVITITSDIKLSDAARLMAVKHIKKLCIVSLNGKLNGIMTEGDVIKHAGYLIKLFQ